MVETNEQTNKQIPEQNIPTNWLEQEEQTLRTNTQTGERLPALKLEENRITDIEVDFSKPFEKWTDSVKKITKAMIKVKHNNELKIWWLNLNNPMYAEIIRAGRKGQTQFKIMQTGSQEKTKYIMVI